jgi:hypothetical protein
MKRILLVLALSGLAAAEAPKGLAELLPASSVAVFEATSLDEETPLEKLCAEPEVARFLEGLRAAFRTAGGSVGPLQILGLSPQDLAGMEIDRAGIGLVDFSCEELADLDLVVAVRFARGEAKAAKVFERLRQAAEQFLGLVFESRQVRGREVWSTHAMRVEVCAAFAGDRFLLTTSAGRMEAILAALEGGRPDPLAVSARFRGAFDGMAAGPRGAVGFLDVKAVAERVLKAFPGPEARRIWERLGLGNVETAAMADTLVDGLWRTECSIRFPKREGLLALPEAGRAPDRFLPLVPPDAILVESERLDAARMLATLRETLRAEPELSNAFEAAVREANEALGIDLQADLLAALGTEWTAYVRFAGLLPEVVGFATLRDREKFEKSVATAIARLNAVALERGGRVTLRETPFRTGTIRFLEICETRGSPVPISPAWMVRDDHVVFGLWPQSVKNALRQPAPFGGVTVLPWFDALRGLVPANASAVTCVDTASILRCLYETGAPILQGVQAAINDYLAPFGTRVPFEDLPPPEVVGKHLRATVLWSSVNETSARCGMISSLGAPAAFAAIALPVAAFAGLVATARFHGPVEIEVAAPPSPDTRERIARLEREIAELNEMLRELEGGK